MEDETRMLSENKACEPGAQPVVPLSTIVRDSRRVVFFFVLAEAQGRGRPSESALLLSLQKVSDVTLRWRALACQSWSFTGRDLRILEQQGDMRGRIQQL